MLHLNTPISDKSISQLNIGDRITISGYIYTGIDAVLPKIVKLYESNQLGKYNINLQSAVIFHTAVSPAGVGPTSSNKFDIENSIPILSKAGVKLHLGKGELSQETVNALKKFNSVYAVIPPITALLNKKTLKRKIIAYPEEGMEAFHQLDVKEFPAIITVANGINLYDEIRQK